MGQQPLDRQMRLAGIGRAEDGLDASGETGVGAEHGTDVWMLRARNASDELGKVEGPLESRRQRVDSSVGPRSIPDSVLSSLLDNGPG